jgi:hypothetical protein
MTNRLMISVAALALVAGTGFANAQGTGMGRESPSAQSSERGTTGGQVNRDTKQPGMKSTQSEERSEGAAKNQRAEEKTKSQSSEHADRAGQNKDKTVGQSTKSEGRENMKSEGREDNDKNAQRTDQKMNKEVDKNAQRTDQKMNKENAQRTDQKMNKENAQRTDQKMNNENAQRTDQKMGNEAEGKGTRSSTVGQAGAGAKLSTEQRTKITSVIREQHVSPVEHVNFSVSVGTRVPRDVRFHPLPAEVVSVYPEWRGYEFILVRDQIVVIDPNTFEIVAVLET